MKIQYQEITGAKVHNDRDHVSIITFQNIVQFFLSKVIRATVEALKRHLWLQSCRLQTPALNPPDYK